MEEEYKEIFEKAKKVLETNWVSLGENAGFTKPSTHLYPFQWNWDSGFIAYGYTHFNIQRAIEELRSLFKGQWLTGFLPHIIFHKENPNYFPNLDFWQSVKTSKDCPQKLQTSGVTQAPIHAMTIWHIYKILHALNEKQALLFIQEFYPKLYELHRYFFTCRDPENTGLITIYHPWESGLDNSPRWDEPLARIKPRNLPFYKRYDIELKNKKYRPNNEDYDKYVYLALNLKNNKYHDELIYPEHEFKIKDPFFSSILYEANKRLQHIAEVLDKDTEEIDGWMKKFEKSIFQKCWNEKDRLFYDYDLISKKQIKEKTAGALMPIITGLLKEEKLKEMLKHLNTPNFCGKGECAIDLVPSIDIKDDNFNHQLYWRGPIWVNINWFLWKGLLRYKEDQWTKHLKENMLKLVKDKGFWEFYSPKTGQGIGARDFSWTAALAIDLLSEEE